jgi:hypothetical protein
MRQTEFTMHKTLIAGIALTWLAIPAQADTCSDLADRAKAALSMKGLDEQTISDLQGLLKESRSGDPMRCEQATGSIFQSSPEGEKAPARDKKCKDEQNSV